MLAGLHRSCFDALLTVAGDRGARPEVRKWLTLSDCGFAGAYLHSLPAAPDRAVTAAFARALEGSTAGDAYCASMPPELRHRLGEYYTPASVVDRLMSAVPGTGTLADPACGDGRFLVSALRRRPPTRVSGCDINPLAVAMARFEVWRALGHPAQPPEIEIAWADFLVPNSRTIPAFTPRPLHFVGNPPWVLWRNLDGAYRAALSAAFADTTLHRARGWAARVAAGQTDLSHLFVHEAIERVTDGGTVHFVVPRTVFKAPVSAAVLRTGRTNSGRDFSYTEVVELPRPTGFSEIRAEAVIARLRADRAQSFPVPWIRAGHGPAGTDVVGGAVPGDADNPESAWIDGDDAHPLRLAGCNVRAKHTARGGINTGGGNGIFHVTVLGPGNEGGVRIRNIPSPRARTRSVEAEIEPTFLHPLLRGTDIGPWRAEPSRHIVLPHDPADLRRPVAEPELRRTAPRTHSYLMQFQSELAARNELARWGGPWYSLFRIGSYTAAGWRIVWPSSAAGNLRAAVLPPGSRVVPDQKVVLLAVADAEVAFFVAAILNSGLLRSAIANGSGLDASPSLLARIPIPQWNPDSPIHQRLAATGRTAHHSRGEQIGEIDELVELLYVDGRHDRRVTRNRRTSK